MLGALKLAFRILTPGVQALPLALRNRIFRSNLSFEPSFWPEPSRNFDASECGRDRFEIKTETFSFLKSLNSVAAAGSRLPAFGGG
jgi:hypothetical protein